MLELKKGIDILSFVGGVDTIDAARKIIDEALDPTNKAKLSVIKNEEALIKIANAITMCEPDSIFVDTGSKEEGNLTSTSFSLTSYYQASLEFYHWRESEASRDFSYLYISTDGSNWDQLYSSDVGISPWKQEIIKI